VKTYPDPKRANGAYKWFVEEMVELAKPGYSTRLSQQGHLERTNEADLPLSDEEARRKELFLRLNQQDRELLGRLLDKARRSAVHDVCSFLEGYLSCEELKISFGGEEIPASPYWTMHYDFVAIREGDIWPDEQED
jgi:hypothetical protein